MDGTNKASILTLVRGQEGDMSFVRGNLAIRDHDENDKSLHLFEYVSRGHVEYIGQMVYQDHKIVEGRDVNGNIRKVIVFILRPVKE